MFSEFITRTQEILDGIESDLLLLNNGFDKESYDNILRQLHTLKGDSGFLSLLEVEQVCHDMESGLNDFPLADVLDLLFEVKDWLVETFRTYENGGLFLKNPVFVMDRLREIEAKNDQAETKQESSEEILEEPLSISKASSTEETEKHEDPVQSSRYASEEQIPVSERDAAVDDNMFAEFITRTQDLLDIVESDLLTLSNGFEQEAYNNVLRQIHTIKGDAGYLGLTEIEHVCHTTETALNIHPLSKTLNILFDVKDWLVETFHTYENGEPFLTNPNSILRQCETLTEESDAPDVILSNETLKDNAP